MEPGQQEPNPALAGEPAEVMLPEPADDPVEMPIVSAPPVVQPLNWLVRSLSGVETGIFGGLVTLFWLLMTGWLLGAPGWVIPNLMAAPFHGQRSLTAEFGYVTLAGIALHLLECAAAAILFAWLASPEWPMLRSLLMGLALSAGAHAVMQAFFLERWNPFLLSYAPPVILWTAGLLFGVVLGCTPWRLRSMRRQFLLE